MKIVFTANGRCASAVVEPAGQPITAGSRGVPAEIHLSPEYDGLVVTAFFRSEYGAWPVVLGETPGTVTIPWEAMEKKSLTFDVGVVGKNGDGTIVIPTIWARAGKIVPATEDSGLEPGDPSADIGAQIVEQARAAAKKAEDAAEAAEEARDKMPRIVDGTWRVYNAVTESWEDTGIQAEGQDGVGISDATMNANYTLTLTFTDGTSYTTPPIRGAQGEPGPIGPTPDISIGTVTTGAAGSQAEATMTGTPERPVLNLTIPRGDPGEVTQAEFDDLADEVSRQKSAIEDLEALTNRKAGMLVDTSSGSIASFVPDATIENLLGVSVAIEPVQDLHGYDSPWPAGGGKNKLHNTATTTTNNGVTFTVNADGSVSCAGTATATAVFKMFQTFSITADIILNGCPSGGDYNSGYSLFMADSRGASVTPNVPSVDTGNGVTIPAQYVSDIVQIQIIARTGTNMDGKVFYPMIRLATETDATFAPYENLCPISGWDAVEVEADGVNLFGGTVINGRMPLDLKPGVTYTASAQFVDPSVSTYFYIQRAPKGTGTYSTFGYILTNYTRTPVTFTADAGYDYAFWSNASYANVKDAQIETGSTASAYHPYAGNRYTIALGDTVYGGTLDVTNGTLTVEYKKYNIAEFSGAWGAVRNGYAVYRTMYATTNRFGLIDATPRMKSNRFKFEYVSREDASLFSYGGANGASVTQTFILPSSITSLAEANAWLADNPTDATFKLETPITIQLDPVTISTISGQTNNVWADAGDVSVEFAADLKHYIDSKIAAAVAAMS